MTEKQKLLVTVLEFCRIESFIRDYSGCIGRPQAERKAIARAFVSKAVYNMPTTRYLLDRLYSDIQLRRICGFETKTDIPSESTFSRAFSEFSNSSLANMVHDDLVQEYLSDELIFHNSRDSTKIEAREKPEKKEEKEEESKPKRKPGRPKKGTEVEKEPTRIEKQVDMNLIEMLEDLPDKCDRGTKKNSKGYKTSWNGYKLHLDASDGGIPISCILTSASLHDSQVAIPLSVMTNEKVTCFYELMDAAFDSDNIKDYIKGLGHVPIIDSNCRKGKKIEFDPAKAQRYKERSTVERVFGRLKDEFGGCQVRVKGAMKVMAHLMFGIIALTVSQLLMPFR